MSSAVAELEAGLQAMLAAKPPGVSGTRINSLTALCMANIKVGLIHQLRLPPPPLLLLLLLLLLLQLLPLHIVRPAPN